LDLVRNEVHDHDEIIAVRNAVCHHDGPLCFAAEEHFQARLSRDDEVSSFKSKARGETGFNRSNGWI
jgi:hypothetical protein